MRPTLRLSSRRVGYPRRVSRVFAALMAAAAGCARPAMRPVVPSGAAVALSGGPNASMAYLARVDGGVVSIDLGWWGAERSVRRALDQLGASPADVTDVFLTHSHRDHVGAWRLVRGARFHLTSAEHPAFTGESRHRGWIPRTAERLRPSRLPRRGEVNVRVFARDTAFAFGRDTLHAYVVPGHTAGSAVYLFRGILFLGDAVTYTRWSGFAPARRGYSDDVGAARRNLRALWARLPRHRVRLVCTAHAKCSAFTPEFLGEVQR